jgi:hypothetical protein
MDQLGFFNQSGFANPNWLTPQKKGEGKNMTKRNLLFVSLLLVLGLGTMATSAFASTVWVPGTSSNNFGRAEGEAEETGLYTLTNNVAGPVAAGDYFTVTYSQPVVAGSVYIVCTGNPPFTGTPNCSPYISATALGNVVTIVFNESVTFTTTGQEIALTVRINATAVKCGTFVTAVGAAFNTNTAVGAGQTISIAGAPQSPDVLYVNCSPNLSFTIAPKDYDVGASGVAAQVLDCIGTKEVGPYDKTFCVNVDEEFQNALTSFSYEYLSDPDATNGTTFTITLTDVPILVTVETPVVTPCTELDTTDPNYCATGTLTVSAGTFSCSADGNTVGPPTQTCTITFTTLTEDNGTPENMDICFRFWSKGPLPAGYVEIYADVAKGPTDSSDIPYFNGTSELPLPGLSVVDFSNCVTNLLFPYINTINTAGTAFAHFGTGIDFANTTWDPWNPAFDTANLYLDEHKGSAVPQSGSCTVYFYPFTEGATVVFATPVISAGGSYAFDAAQAGFRGSYGYAIAICGFQNAYGFAEIYDNYGVGDPTATLGYLAYIIPDPAFYRRSPAGDALGEESIAPINLNRFWQKFFLYDPPKK